METISQPTFLKTFQQFLVINKSLQTHWNTTFLIINQAMEHRVRSWNCNRPKFLYSRFLMYSHPIFIQNILEFTVFTVSKSHTK